MQISYLDLYLVHVPFAFENGEDLHPYNENGEIRIDVDTDHLQIWSAMEKQVLEKRTKAIGLSNFNIGQIKKILDNAKLPVSNLQIELHVDFQQKELVYKSYISFKYISVTILIFINVKYICIFFQVKFCQDNNISITAYSPLGTRGIVKKMGKTDTIPNLLENPIVLEIAEKYNKTPAQILLKHIIQKGIIAIPKSSTPTRIKENIQLFDWELRVEDVDKLNAIDMGESARICDFFFFKGIEKHPEFPF